MADLTKRAGKRLRDHLADGETVEVAILLEPKGTYGPGMVAVALLPRTMARHLEGRAGAASAEEGGLAARFPSRSAVLAVTDRRIVVAPSNGLSFGAPELELDRAEVTIGRVARKGLGRRLQLVFADGSAIEVDLQRGQPLDRLETAIGRLPEPAP